jgi:aminoglycoside phosphotransferase (APT) family kinase protein
MAVVAGSSVGELRFEQDLVRALLRDQHPDLADLELRDVSGGWDNQQWRLGDELAVRLPRTERAPALLHTERTWLPVLADRLPLPTPVPVRVGKPSSLFEHTWTITRWVVGEPADRAPITRIEAAEVLAGFLRALHHRAPADAPANPLRGIPLARLQEGVDSWFELLADYPDAGAAREVWDRAVAAPAWQGAPLWLHGDLHPANVVVRDGILAGVIDFGEMCAGDPATDLSAAWILLPAGAASRFFDAYERADEATVTRARGWAVLRALGLIGIGQAGRLGRPGGKPTWEPAGYATLERVLAAN